MATITSGVDYESCEAISPLISFCLVIFSGVKGPSLVMESDTSSLSGFHKIGKNFKSTYFFLTFCFTCSCKWESLRAKGIVYFTLTLLMICDQLSPFSYYDVVLLCLLVFYFIIEAIVKNLLTL